MYATIFSCPRAIDRYQSAPLLDERTRYLSYWAECGGKLNSLRSIAYYQLNLVNSLDLKAGVLVHRDQVEQAARQWQKSIRRCNRTQSPGIYERRYIHHSLRWLRFIDQLAESKPRHKFDAELQAFKRYAFRERGWSDRYVTRICFIVSTIVQSWMARPFACFFWCSTAPDCA